MIVFSKAYLAGNSETLREQEKLLSPAAVRVAKIMFDRGQDMSVDQKGKQK